MLEAVSDGLLNLLNLFRWLLARIFGYNNLTPQLSLDPFKYIFGFIIAFSVVFMAIKVIKKLIWGK